MVFKDIFDFARNAANDSSIAETTVSGYVAKQPNEAISVPPHDPWQSVTITQQDPKIVRETAPQAQAMFQFIEGITSAIKTSGDKIETAINDPKSVVTPSEQVMNSAQDIARNITDNVPSPSKNDK